MSPTQREAAAGSGAGKPILGSAQGGLRFELVRAEDDANGPFVCLHSGRFSQVLLGRIAIGDEALRSFALKVQRDNYLPGGSGMSRPLTNLDVDAMWERELDELRRIDSLHVVDALPIDGGYLHSRPVFYCTRIDAYFHPMCQRSLTPLTVCKDDELLRDCGLRAFSNGLVRYLHCGEAKEHRSFYRTGGAFSERPKSGVTLRVGGELYRDWRELVHGELADGDRERVEAEFPCRSCSHNQSCYPKDAKPEDRIPAEDVLVPVSYYDFCMVPLRVLDLTYDEACDLIGGAPWPLVKASAAGPGCRGRGHVLDRLDPAFAAPLQWMFQHDDELFLMEILRLKLAVLGEVCEGLRAVHKTCERPHFAVAPANFMLSMLPQSASFPARWNFQTKLIDLGSPLQFTPPDSSARDAPLLLEPGGECRGSPYLSPLVALQDGLSGPMQVTVLKREEDGDSVVLHLEASGASLRMSEFRPGDVVRLLPSAVPGYGTEVWLWTEVVEVQRNRVKLLASVPGTHSCASWEASKSLDANLTFFKKYGTSCDLFGLGMLLFRTLLVNDEQDMMHVEEVVRRCLSKLEMEDRGGMDEAAWRSQVSRRLREESACFDPTAVLYRQSDRARVATALKKPKIFSRSLWKEILVFGFRLVTNLRGFSFAESHAETHPHNPAALMTEVLEQVGRFLWRIHVDMFASTARNQEIGGVCEEMLSELRGEMMQQALEEETDTREDGNAGGRATEEEETGGS